MNRVSDAFLGTFPRVLGTTALEIVNRFYGASTKKLAGLQEMKEMLTGDISFEGPANKTSGAKQYMALNEQLLLMEK